ncbi:hypothetical protein EDB81DRAFT_914342 [Dactylonectria macrodidyma]|uniref:Zn(2)-C6 fungal-type domain-containing protein n=1 Tax=Dactylonectria macrodidyma TaxID=307937 RepID=A0A9P9IHS8_9HYPO|nr:hypothetical protein EDB81DRAFT_914342 [Dactylonectria macrodidyma]
MTKGRACDSCRRRKIRCVFLVSKTICDWCGRHGLDCTSNKPQTRSKKTKARQGSPTFHESLSLRMERVEQDLVQIIARRKFAGRLVSLDDFQDSAAPLTNSAHLIDLESPIANRSSPTTPPESELPDLPNPRIASFSHIHFSGHHIGKISHHTGVPKLSDQGRKWLSSRTGENVTFHQFQTFTNERSLSAASHVSSLPPQLCELPNEELIWRLFDDFQHSAFRLVYPILDRVLFADTMAFAYTRSDGPPLLKSMTARCCILAFLSIACLFQTRASSISDLDSDACAVKAHYILVDVFQEGSLLGLQAVVMLHLYHVMTGRLQSATMLHAVACRWIFMLGGHAYTSVRPSDAELTHLQRETRLIQILFWLCYLIDKDMALRLNQPPLMSDEYCELIRPEDDPSFLVHQPNHDVPDLRPQGHESLDSKLLGDLRLGQLKGKISRLLYSAQAARQSDAGLLHNIRQLDDELETWRMSIPMEYRPTLSVSENLRVSQLEKTDILTRMRYILLHLEYHYLMTSIHRASGRCLTSCCPNNSQASSVSSVSQSSMALVLEASRSTLIFLRAAIRSLPGECFWILVFYPTTAIMSLFLNVVTYPLGPLTKADLELISSAASLVKHMPVCRLTLRELEYMSLVHDFIAELVRLGNLAIKRAKAKQE